MQSTATAPDQRVAHLAVTWALMVPMFFFACKGVLWFQSAEGNNNIGAYFSGLAVGGSGVSERLTLPPILGIVFALVLLRLSSTLAVAARGKVFIGLAVLALASTIWSQFPSKSFSFAVCLLINTFFAFYLVARLKPIQLMRVLLILGWIILIMSYCFSLFLPKYGIDHRGSQGSIGAWQGVFAHKNLGAIMLIFLMTIVFYLPAKSLLAKVSRAMYIGMTLVFLVLSQSTTGYIICAALFAFIFALKSARAFKARDRAFVVVVGLSVALALGALVAGQYENILRVIGKDPSLTGRTGIWAAVLMSCLKHPITGYGYRAFFGTAGLQGEGANVDVAAGWMVTGAHNGFLEVWLDLGGLGLGMVILSFVKAVKDSIYCLRQREVTQYTDWYICIIFLTMISNLDEQTVLIPNYLAWVIYIVACIGLADEARKLRARLPA